MTTIRIACEPPLMIPLGELKVIQGNLKELSKKNYKKLSRAIETCGFTSPINVGKNAQGEWCVMDGTQRVRTILKKVELGEWDFPAVPAVKTLTEDKKDTAKKLIHMASSYGRSNREGLSEYMEAEELTQVDLECVSLAGVDNDNFLESHGPDDESEKCQTCGRKMPTK